MSRVNLTVMLKTRCGCTRILSVPKSSLESGHYYIEFVDDAFSYLSRRSFMGVTTDRCRRLFEHRHDYDKATGLPLYFEEGYYA